MRAPRPRASVLVLACALAGTLSGPLASPASAQDDTAASEEAQETQRIKDATEQIKAETERFKAETDRFNAQIDALGLPKTEGKTTLEGEGGKLEGWMLASATLTAAAEAISKGAAAKAPAGPIVLLDNDDVLDLRIGQLLQSDVDVLVAAHRKAGLAIGCSDLAGGGGAAALVVPATAIIGTVLSLLKTDTTISGFSFDTPDGALLNAIAGSKPGTYILPADLVAATADGQSLKKLKELAGFHEAAQTCRARIASAAGSEAAKQAAAPHLAMLDALATRTQAFLDAVSERKDEKPSRLELAMVADGLLEKIDTTSVLRVHVEKAGGSLLKRSNLFTMLGAPAVGITGGTVISWRLSSPVSGTSLAGGILVCRTKLTNLNAIHAGKVRIEDSSCGAYLAPAPRKEQ